MRAALLIALGIAAAMVPAAHAQSSMETYESESFSFSYPASWSIYDIGVAEWDGWRVPVWAFGSDGETIDSRLYVADVPPVIGEDEKWSDSLYLARMVASEADFCESGEIAWGRYSCEDFEVTRATHYSILHPYYLVVYEWVREYDDGTSVKATSARIDVPGEDRTQVMYAESPTARWDSLGLLESVMSFLPPGGFEHAEPTMTMLAENVYRYYDGYGTLVVIGDDEVLITDTANAPRAETLKAAIAELTDAPVTMIALSHEHYDHIGGTGVFEEAQVICHANCAPIFAISTLMDVPEVDIEFDKYYEVDVDGITVELHYIAPGDGDATTVIYLPDEQILYTSDLYTPYGLTDGRWITDTNLLGTRAILNEVSTWDVEHAISDHYLSTNPADLMAATGFFNDLHDAVHSELAKALQSGGPLGVFTVQATLPETLELPKYASWENYEDLPRYVARMAEAITHGD